MSLLSEIVGFRSAFNILCALDKAPVKGISWQALHAMASSDSGPDKAEEIIDQLLSSALIRCEGHYIRLTTFGVKTFLLLEALNGGDISSLFGRLSQLGEVAPTYELVRQGMTEKFLESLVTRPGFCRLYICSPWINLSRRARGFLVHAILQIEKRRRKAPELLVITRPDPQARTTAPATVKPLVDLGASVFLHAKLHSKLYIREPGSEGGLLLAILGSENLTRSMNLELGIRINSDSSIINKLIRYFWDVSSYCAEL